MTSDGRGRPLGDISDSRVAGCVERTLRAPGARIEFARDTAFRWRSDRRRRRRGGLLRPVGQGVKLAARRAWKLVADDANWGHLDAEGIIDPTGRRFMVDHGSFAETFQDGVRLGGRSGRTLDTLDPWPNLSDVDPLWMLDVLRGITDVTCDGEDSIRGSGCRRVIVHVDVGRASAATPDGRQPPPVDQFEELLAFPATVWVDDENVRKIQLQLGPTNTTLTLELWDFDVSPNEFDWTRLPTFRSPQEDAVVR